MHNQTHRHRASSSGGCGAGRGKQYVRCGRRRPRCRTGPAQPGNGRSGDLLPLAQGVFCMTHCPTARLLTRRAPAYRLARAVTCFSVIVPRTGRWVGAAVPDSGERTGVDVETFPGGGEPSAVSSDFCSASVFAIGTGLTTGSFMSMTFAVRRNAACGAVSDLRLSLDAHDVHHSGLAGSTTCPGSMGSCNRPACRSTAQDQTATFRGVTCRRTPTRGQTSERP
jgi:hypothetical protein